jgi:hypothetical protein
MQIVFALLSLAVRCYAACLPATKDNADGMWASLDHQNAPIEHGTNRRRQY